MAEQDSLSDFDFGKVTKPGKYLKFEAGKPVTVRILTKDPVVQERTFEGDGDVNIRTSFCFIVWNFTDEKAQILTAGPKMAKTFQRIGKDEDFGANLQKCDIKISPEGEKLGRTYDINVVRHSGNEKVITASMAREAQAINLDTDVQDNRGRLSTWQPEAKTTPVVEDEPPIHENNPMNPDKVITDISDEPIDLDSIPF